MERFHPAVLGRGAGAGSDVTILQYLQEALPGKHYRYVSFETPWLGPPPTLNTIPLNHRNEPVTAIADSRAETAPNPE